MSTNGYNNSEQEWMKEWYRNYRAISARSGIIPADYDRWVIVAMAIQEMFVNFTNKENSHGGEK